MSANKNFTRRRWLVLVLYGIINLCVGALYAWSVFAGPLQTQLNVGSLSMVYTVATSIGPVTMIGGGFANAMGGAVIAESVFSMPGVGLYLTNSINSLDYAVVRSSVVILSVWFSIIMLITDLVYAFVDPRIKAQYTGR